jgi:hypothetical protein
MQYPIIGRGDSSITVCWTLVRYITNKINFQSKTVTIIKVSNKFSHPCNEYIHNGSLPLTELNDVLFVDHVCIGNRQIENKKHQNCN